MDIDSLQTMLGKIVDGDNTGAKEDFENIISQKLNAALDAKKAEVAQSIYGSQESEDEEGEEEQIEPQEQDTEDAVQ